MALVMVPNGQAQPTAKANEARHSELGATKGSAALYCTLATHYGTSARYTPRATLASVMRLAIHTAHVRE